MIDDYADETVEACRSVLLEVLTILGKQREHLVVVGGWVPLLLFGRHEHIGSIDVDLALDWRNLSDYVYETIRRDLERQGYFQKPEGPDGRFWRVVERGHGSIEIKVDFLTGGSEPAATRTHRFLQGLTVWCARGVEVALEHTTSVEISGSLPNGGENNVTVKIASAAALIMMKGIALDERLKEKDAYDIYFCLKHHPGGITGLAGELQPLVANATVRRALETIRDKFATLDSVGPVWAAQVAQTAGEDYEQVRRDAYERAAALITGILLSPM